MEGPGIIDRELAIYIFTGIMGIVAYLIKRITNRIEKNYDKHVEDDKQSNKELWIELNNLRERVATLEGSQKNTRE